MRSPLADKSIRALCPKRAELFHPRPVSSPVSETTTSFSLETELREGNELEDLAGTEKMGCCQSRIELEETISRCRGRRRYTKQLVKERQAFATAHFLYLRSLRCTGSSLVQFANVETPERHHLPPLAPSPPPTPPPPQRNTTSAAGTMTSASASPILRPPPPPPAAASGWDFWDPFFHSSPSLGAEWEDSSTAATTTTASEAPPPPPPELSVVASSSKKSLQEIVNELDDYFLKAADAGERVAAFLEVPNCGFSSNQGLTGE